MSWRKYMSKKQFVGQEWPRRAVVTAGMPYGNKELHFGHIAGVFIPADCYARFLRDRIGSSNVRFVSGTDCYGSPINEGYRKLVESNEFKGSIEDYVKRNHDKQVHALELYDISLDIYEGSGIGEAGKVHKRLTQEFIKRLYEKGHLKLMSTLQYYDEEAGVFLNGRQVIGRCPVQGCKSDHGYADECSLGHSYSPEDLIAPKSTLTGSTPQMKPVDNWYFDLPNFRAMLIDYMKELEADEDVRSIVVKACSEFLVPPIIYVKNDDRELCDESSHELPLFELREAEKGKASFELEFSTIDDRDIARDIMHRKGIRFRTGKALVPFRITGNIEWGVPAPVIDDVDGLTVWCWPESLWAPISFTIAANEKLRRENSEQDHIYDVDYADFWCSDDAKVYQFIGQDNLYFYGIAQPALWEALKPGNVLPEQDSSSYLRQTELIANYHILFGNKKASSSGSVKPPTADELLEHYTIDQLRSHFLALGLDQRSVGFKPKAFERDEIKNNPRVADPVLKEYKLLKNVFNRLARSVLYEAKNHFHCSIPLLDPTDQINEKAVEVCETYDDLMKKSELHSIMTLMDDFIRYANKYWADGISHIEHEDNPLSREQLLSDAAYLLWIATLLMHPIVPAGCENICSKLKFDPQKFFSWDHQFISLKELDSNEYHEVEALEQRYDFF